MSDFAQRIDVFGNALHEANKTPRASDKSLGRAGKHANPKLRDVEDEIVCCSEFPDCDCAELLR